MIAKELNISPITIKAHLDNKVLKPKKFIFRWSNNNINKNINKMTINIIKQISLFYISPNP